MASFFKKVIPEISFLEYMHSVLTGLKVIINNKDKINKWSEVSIFKEIYDNPIGTKVIHIFKWQHIETVVDNESDMRSN